MKVKVTELVKGNLVLLPSCGKELYHIVVSHREEKFMGAISEHLVLETGKGKRFFKRLDSGYMLEVSDDNKAPLCVHHHQESEND